MTTLTDIPHIFNRNTVRKHRTRASYHLHTPHFLPEEISHRMMEKLADLSGSFSSILLLGCGLPELSNRLQKMYQPSLLVCQDISETLAARSTGYRLAGDEEHLPYAPASFDLVISLLTLHNVNDLPGSLRQIRHILKPDGIFLGSLFGSGTLAELRQSLTAVELKTYGGAGIRISPFTEVKTMGQLLQRAGFALPVADTEPLTVAYDSVISLFHDLRHMGEACALANTPPPLTRSLLAHLSDYYTTHFSDSDDGFLATFDIISVTGLAAGDRSV